jgi:Ulp1 family protease
MISLYAEDQAKIKDGQFWNDNLIDLWMRWISRKESSSQSAVNFFTAHFYSTLVRDGVDGVSKWTTKKGIDIFSKKVIFIPVNLDSHWSLKAIFSPLMVSVVVDVDDLDPDEMEWTALIFLDSLKLHNSTKIASNIRLWLIHEWSKKTNADCTYTIFNEQSLRLYKPQGKSTYVISIML